MPGAEQLATKPRLEPTCCAICGTTGEAVELYPVNFHAEDLNPATFSARRLPDRIHFRLVRCRHCELVRSDPIIPAEVLHALYVNSEVTYEREIVHLRYTYGRQLERCRQWATRWNSLLEIGCGNGFFLEEALAHGFDEVHGIEPSRSAALGAVPSIRDRIICDQLRPGLFGPSRFDLVCFFQVFDHLVDPASVLAECRRLLRPGGVLLCVNHNIEALPVRLCGKRSPVVDIEHTYLYSPVTMSRIVRAAGFDIREAGRVWNRYSLGYLTQLLPLPAALKRPLLSGLTASGLGRVPLSVPLGNLYQIAQKPVHGLEHSEGVAA